ncbi:MAG: hypothetical protein FWG87_13845 [Defluviitaleaceae bacterium]|nr:hypothetical protein [Defluviitaleaceae bacterium]
MWLHKHGWNADLKDYGTRISADLTDLRGFFSGAFFYPRNPRKSVFDLHIFASYACRKVLVGDGFIRPEVA